ncbi:MAG: helix-turn-helix transcriptional regulator, partial [Bacteroidota bacterium]
PFFLIWYIWKDVIFTPGPEKKLMFQKYPSELFGVFIPDLVTYIFPIQGFIYIGLALYLFYQYKKQHANKLTDYSRVQINYLIRLYQCLMGLVLLLQALTFFPALGNLWPNYIVDFIGIFVPIIVYFISYLALFNPGGLFEKIELAKPVFKSRQLPRDQSKRYAAKLEKIMQNEAPYLEPELNQEELARALCIQPRQLSRLLKQQFNCTFTEYINAYRVEKVKALMEDPKHRHWSLMAIAFEAGFNSKSTFNRIFKKQMGLTPREYSQQYQD